MSELTFEIRPSPKTNDHEVRVLVDGENTLGDDHMGIDPPEFFAQFSRANAGQLLIGRCKCGTVGCDDYVVAVKTEPDIVIWQGSKEFRFVRSTYDDAVHKASNDFSWEDQKRRAERLAGILLSDCQTDDGFTYQWVSARIAPMLMKISFLKDDQQKLLEYSWDGATDESAMLGARRFRAQLGGI